MVSATAVDLFAGAGGGTQGLKDAGFRVLAGVEADEAAAETYRRNHPEVILWEEDIRDVRAEDLLGRLDLAPGQLTLLKSCPPCQAFSSRGSRNALDPRNDLVLDVFRFVRCLRPRVVIMENVRHLSTDDRFSRLLRQLRGAGYSTSFRVLDAAAFGVPQRRRRLVMVGFSKAARVTPAAEWFDSLPMRSDAGFEDALVHLSHVEHRRDDPASRWRRSRHTVAARIRAIPPNGGREDLPPDLRLACHDRLDSVGPRVATESYGRIRTTGPAPTMTTRCTTPSCGRFIHPTEDRGISLREAAALQTFPATYEFSGRYDEMERQIGNALPPLMAAAIAKHALEGMVR